ncbi:hypothetical protein Pla86_38470 [Planctomycetes bacterium Pla86]|uniref:Uncharacterized protein n=1 Tax=Engelhardtia mirabilis TaxID=2528011 RepID=A0A518BP41_9BACT|nr:hypothetical protein Pla133_38480 [Planctomycetes bacterium Pla133]QDV03072.1 hypothetical protein Pla86_38470 [Planctomycetes bacterium Pla86]
MCQRPTPAADLSIEGANSKIARPLYAIRLDLAPDPVGSQPRPEPER